MGTSSCILAVLFGTDWGKAGLPTSEGSSFASVSFGAVALKWQSITTMYI